MAHMGIIEFVMYKHENEHFISFDFNNNKKSYIPFPQERYQLQIFLKN